MCEQCGFDPTKHKVLLSDTVFIYDKDGEPDVGMHRHHEYTTMEMEEVSKLPMDLRRAIAVLVIAENLDWVYALTEGKLSLIEVVDEAKIRSEAYIIQIAEKMLNKIKEFVKTPAEEDPAREAHLN